MASPKGSSIPAKWKWFADARFGMFVHFGPYAAYGRGEQVLFREHLSQPEYVQAATRWNPRRYDPDQWAAVAKGAGMKYCVLTSRHHDGYCLWDSKVTDYSSAQLAPKRDLIGDYVKAFRKAGLRVGIYYSLADWRIPAYFRDCVNDPDGWAKFRRYVHDQIRELLTNYGRIDVLWFDGAWPHTAEEWGAHQIIRMARKLQPNILINNRLDTNGIIGDFGTPEHRIVAETGRMWESCQVSTWRLWGYTIGERWRPTDLLLDFLVQTAGLGGNLLLNVGPKPNGELPAAFVKRMAEIGEWMAAHGEAIYGSEPGDVCEFITYGRQTRRGNNLYLIVRFWDGRETLHLAGLQTRVRSATLLTTGQKLPFDQQGDQLYIGGLPRKPPTKLFPVIELVCKGKPEAADWAKDRLWQGDPERMVPWAAQRGEGVMVNGDWPSGY